MTTISSRLEVLIRSEVLPIYHWGSRVIQSSPTREGPRGISVKRDRYILNNVGRDLGARTLGAKLPKNHKFIALLNDKLNPRVYAMSL